MAVLGGANPLAPCLVAVSRKFRKATTICAGPDADATGLSDPGNDDGDSVPYRASMPDVDVAGPHLRSLMATGNPCGHPVAFKFVAPRTTEWVSVAAGLARDGTSPPRTAIYNASEA